MTKKDMVRASQPSSLYEGDADEDKADEFDDDDEFDNDDAEFDDDDDDEFEDDEEDDADELVQRFERYNNRAVHDHHHRQRADDDDKKNDDHHIYHHPKNDGHLPNNGDSITTNAGMVHGSGSRSESGGGGGTGDDPRRKDTPPQPQWATMGRRLRLSEDEIERMKERKRIGEQYLQQSEELYRAAADRLRRQGIWNQENRALNAGGGGGTENLFVSFFNAAYNEESK